MTEPQGPKSRVATLTRDHHDRDVVGFTYVYPVVSRRSNGVSIGINLNPNNACNWRCVYCQVKGLVRGAAPATDLVQLERELEGLLDAIEFGGFLEAHVAAEHRTVTDLALSGNGEPTSSPQLMGVIELLGRIRNTRELLRNLPVVLITNGSLADRDTVKAALSRLREIGGRVWFKLDAGSDQGLHQTNSSATTLERHLRRLDTVAHLCPTFVQSCWFCRNGHAPEPEEVARYLTALESLVANGTPLEGVQLYTLARESHQPESATLAPVADEWLTQLARAVESIGLPVHVAR
jgi:wyosine [tRNA(Phe)-imidazoG37] synthetase (radical SAM superfamily)